MYRVVSRALIFPVALSQDGASLRPVHHGYNILCVKWTGMIKNSTKHTHKQQHNNNNNNNNEYDI